MRSPLSLRAAAAASLPSGMTKREREKNLPVETTSLKWQNIVLGWADHVNLAVYY